MKQTQLLDSVVAAGVLHGLRELSEAKGIGSKMWWGFFMLLFGGTMSIIMLSVSRQFFNDESALSTTTTAPTRFPVLHFCPVKIPEDVVLAAGYTREVAKRLNDVLQMSFSQNHSTSSPDAFAAIDSIGDQSIDQVLMNVGQAHAEVINITGEVNFVSVKFPITKSVSLASTGYCFSIETRPGYRFIRHTIRISWVTLEFWSAEQLRQANGLYFELTSNRGNHFFRPTMSAEKGSLVISAKWQQFDRRATARKACDPQSADIFTCLHDCVGDVKCYITGSTDNCEMYKPNSSQSLNKICDGVSSHRCLTGSPKLRGCLKLCRAPCTTAGFVYETAAGHFPLRNPHAALGVRLRVVGVTASLHFTEQKAVDPIVYISYLGGNLGTFFGVSFIALITCLSRYTEKKIRLKTKRSKMFRKVTMFATWTLLFGLAVPFVQAFTNIFSQKITTSAMSFKTALDHNNLVFSFMIPWLSESKMAQVLSLPVDLLVNESNVHQLATSKKLPFMCDYIQSLYLGDPFTKQFDVADSQVISQVSHFEILARNNNIIKSIGLKDTLKKMAVDPDVRISGVFDGNRKPLSYFAYVKSLSATLGYQVRINFDNVTDLSKTLDGITVKLARSIPSDAKCRDAMLQALFVADQIEEIEGLESDFVIFSQNKDYTFHISADTVELKNTKARPCSPEMDSSACMWSCLDRKAPCACDSLIYAEMPRPLIKDPGNVCHQFLPVYAQCPATRALNRQAIDFCEVECVKPCKRTIFSITAKVMRARNDTVQELKVMTSDSAAKSLHVTEFFVYDWIKLACALGGIFSTFYGYSFIALCSALGNAKNMIVCPRSGRR